MKTLVFGTHPLKLCSNPCRFSIVLLLRFVRCLKENLDMMFLQESEKVNRRLEVGR